MKQCRSGVSPTGGCGHWIQGGDGVGDTGISRIGSKLTEQVPACVIREEISH